MREQVALCCKTLRLGQQADASELLIPILDYVALQLNNLPTTIANKTQKCLVQALEYQQTQDLIALADELEYILLPLMETETAFDA